MSLIARVGHHLTTPKATARNERNTPAGLRAGLAHIARSPLLRGPLISNGVFLTANAALTALLVPFVTGPLSAPGASVGYLISGLGVGFVVGSVASRSLLDRYGIRQVLSATQLASGIAYFALFNAPSLAAAVAAAVLIGLPGSILLISVETHIQRTAPPGMLGRVGALFFAMDSLAAIVGALTAPILVAIVGLTAALNAISAAALLAAPLTWALSPRPPPGAACRERRGAWQLTHGAKPRVRRRARPAGSRRRDTAWVRLLHRCVVIVGRSSARVVRPALQCEDSLRRFCRLPGASSNL
ncbi:MFS transporter [Streptomyces sp. NPDC002896]|uniref:MFS transporter n=1 Tax=Streptomyces sp. NPDC002896 TaxID=3154438 RepID=UPI0033347F3D